MSFKYSADVNQLPNCCGFLEAGNFQKSVSPFIYNEIIESTPKQALNKVLSMWDSRGRPVMFNFVRFRKVEDDEDSPLNEKYEAEWLRKLVVKHKDAVHIATYINPNTGNEIDSWVILNNLKTVE